MKSLLFALTGLLLGSGCAIPRQDHGVVSTELPSVSPDYWHRGVAEISRFDLEQVRYGQRYRGHAILIFVKEEFLPTTHVKYEGAPTRETPVTILKHLTTRDFVTGVYPYSMMTSVFSPFSGDPRQAYKVTASTHDWCGQTFMQVNDRHDSLQAFYRSYFQEEGDRWFTMPSVILEDAIWNLIRTNPQNLPLGTVAFLPSLHCVQLRIKEFQEHVAEASLERILDPSVHPDSALVYTLTYQDVPRVFSITFEAAWPHRILAWEETEDRLLGRSEGSEPPMRTRAVRTHTIMDDYWNHSAPADSSLRDRLGLP